GYPIGVGVPASWGNQGETPNPPIAQSSQAAEIARLTSIGEDVAWDAVADGRLEIGSPLQKGWLEFDAGTIEVTFRSGAVVQISGPASFAVDSPLRGFLNYGSVRVYAPESARDFAVGTASMEVVDLGTAFDLSVDRQSGSAEIDVVEGLVDLHLANAGAAQRIQSLSGGQSASIAASGKITEKVGDTLDPRLLAHWKLDDNGEDQVVLDSSAHQRHGELNVPTKARSMSGKVGGALRLGTDGYVDFSQHLEALTETSAFTLTAWVRNADDIVFSVSDGTRRQRVQFELHGSWLYYGWGQGDSFDRISAGVSGWQADRWYHVAVSYSGGNVTIYRDGRALIEPKRTGVVINTRAMAPIDLENPTVAYLGFLPSNHIQQPQSLGGELDDVQIYGRALDEVAIRTLYENPGETLLTAEKR
ncbi:MAG: LamG-like jellyroll fold domain-containing protein, partial [Blastopirellula sp. JB062]